MTTKLGSIRVAQIGVGYWGPNLLRNLAGAPEWDLRMVADLSPERRAFVRELYPGVSVTDAPETIFAAPDIDAVVISTPAASHFRLGMTALASGKHILVEKPLATSVAEVDQLAAAAAARDLVVMVGHVFLFNNAVRFIHDFIAAGALGDLRYIASQRVNLGRVRSDVDALWNFAPHDVSIFQYLLGNPQPVSVRRQGMTYIQAGIEDVCFLHIEYADRMMAHAHVSWLDPRKVRTMTVVGTKKMIVYDDLVKKKIAIYDKGVEPLAVLGERMDFDQAGFEYRDGGVDRPDIEWVEPLRVELSHFADCIRTRCPCLAGLDHARSVVHILECAE